MVLLKDSHDLRRLLAHCQTVPFSLKLRPLPLEMYAVQINFINTTAHKHVPLKATSINISKLMC